MSQRDVWTRREVLGVGLTAALAPRRELWGAAGRAASLAFTLEETAGLRRFGYPVHTLLPGGVAGPNFRLKRGDRVIPAQFRRVVAPGGREAVALDFTSSIGPLERESYIVEAGPDVAPGPEPTGGLRLEPSDAAFRIRSGPALEYRLARNLDGFLQQVRNADREYLAPGGGGLSLRLAGRVADDRPGRGGARPRGAAGDATPWRGVICRQGPLAVGLRFERQAIVPGDRALAETVDLTFPSTKSWVEATWTVDDPAGAVAGMEVDLRFALDGEATLVDLGTAATIYGVLRGRERMTLTAGTAPGSAPAVRPWAVHKGKPDAMALFAEAPRPDAPPAEGWAHAMDSSRCTAVAVAEFGRHARDQIAIETDGRLRIVREFAAGEGDADADARPPRGRKALTFWLHFVPMPVQVGAATSPQSMLAPLAIRWEAPEG